MAKLFCLSITLCIKSECRWTNEFFSKPFLLCLLVSQSTVLASSKLMFHHSLYRQHNSKIIYLNKIRLDSSCLNGQATLLEYNTLKGVYQVRM